MIPITVVKQFAFSIQVATQGSTETVVWSRGTRKEYRRNRSTQADLELFSSVHGTRNVIEYSCFGPEPNRGS